MDRGVHSGISNSHRSHFGSRYPIWLKRLASLPFLDPGSDPGAPFSILAAKPLKARRATIFFLVRSSTVLTARRKTHIRGIDEERMKK